MTLKFINAVGVQTFCANDNSAYVPQMWAQESLAILEENMVAANLVHRDFSPLIASYGDTVNTRRPSKFTALRKTGTEPVTDQDAVATNVPVVLDQLIHVTFVIYDSEASKSFKDLVTEYMRPAMLAHAQFLDKVVLGQVANFMANSYGSINAMTTTNAIDDILGTREKMNKNLAYVDGRNLILSPTTETTLLNLPIFTQAQQVGDQGQALQEAFIGRKYGFNTYMCQHMSSVLPGNTIDITYLINNGNVTPGSTVITVDTGSSTTATANSWISIDGEGIPHRLVTAMAAPGTVTITPPLQNTILNNAVVTSYTPGLVNQTSTSRADTGFATGYPAGFNKEITIDGFSVAPQVGQLVSFGTSTAHSVYTIVAVNGVVGIVLDRSLEQAIADEDSVNISPAGEYNFAFHRNAIALVTRPMELPRQGIGAAAANVNYNGLSVRVVLTYDGKAQGTRVTLDILAGIKTLDTNLGAVMLA
jgi:hypothetical protein